MNIGVLFSSKDIADKFVNTLCKKSVYNQKTFLRDNVIKIELLNDVLFVYVCGVGQNNAIIGCSELYNEFNCRRIKSIEPCSWLHSKDSIQVGSIFEFNNNIINYDFKLKPLRYSYDDCKVSNYSECKIEDNLLMTCNDEMSSSEVLDNLNLKWQRYSNIFADTNGYAVLAYCKEKCIFHKIIRFVVGYSYSLDDVDFDKLVDYFI